MAELTQEAVVEYLSKLTVMEIAQLTKILEEKWGVSAAPVAAVGAVAMPAPGPAAAEEVKKEEQTEFTVELVEVGPKKIEVVKAIRNLTQINLKEAKELTESAPTIVKQGLSKADAENMKKVLEEAGAKVNIK